jgi:hypothetical protein
LGDERVSVEPGRSEVGRTLLIGFDHRSLGVGGCGSMTKKQKMALGGEDWEAHYHKYLIIILLFLN